MELREELLAKPSTRDTLVDQIVSSTPLAPKPDCKMVKSGGASECARISCKIVLQLDQSPIHPH